MSSITNSRAHIGNAIKERREVLGLTQKELADRLGVGRAYVWQVEAGQQNLTLDRLDEIATALKTKVTLKLK